MKWIRENLLAVVLLVLFVVLMGGMLWLQRAANQKRTDLDARLQSLRQEFQQLSVAKPVPAKETLDIVQANHKLLREKYDALADAMGSTHVTATTNMTAIEFGTKLRQKLARLQVAATNAHVAVPENFPFGFSAYDKVSPRPAEAPELYKQLLIVEKLTDILISNKVDAISQVLRVAVESEGAGTDALEDEIYQDPSGAYQSMPFQIRFACSTDALRGILNSLSQSDWFFVVKNMELATETIAIAAPAATPATPAPSHTGLSRPGLMGRVPTETSTEPQPTVTRTRLVVTLRISLVEFLDSEKPQQAAAPKPSA